MREPVGVDSPAARALFAGLAAVSSGSSRRFVCFQLFCIASSAELGDEGATRFVFHILIRVILSFFFLFFVSVLSRCARPRLLCLFG